MKKDKQKVNKVLENLDYKNHKGWAFQEREREKTRERESPKIKYDWKTYLQLSQLNI